jgi:hypothetical protein
MQFHSVPLLIYRFGSGEGDAIRYCRWIAAGPSNNNVLYSRGEVNPREAFNLFRSNPCTQHLEQTLPAFNSQEPTLEMYFLSVWMNCMNVNEQRTSMNYFINYRQPHTKLPR